MGWIFGHIGLDRREELRRHHGQPLYRKEGSHHYIQAGGLPGTCHGGNLPADGAWFVVGLGIKSSDEGCRFLSSTDWQTLLAQPQPDITGIDGHFVAIRYADGRAEVFTDQLGTRTLFLTQLTQGIAFSTRMDWLVALRGGADIDFKAFGSHWVLFNQLSTDSLVRNLVRLGPGGHAIIQERSMQLSGSPWTPDIAETDSDGQGFARILSAFCHPQSNHTSSLGLSGGLDSRLLLSLGRNRCTHVFGPPHSPDVRISQQIAEKEGARQHHFHEDCPPLEDCITLLKARAATTPVISAASSVLGLRYYGALHKRGMVIIDGGLGEAARRQFMNRLLWLGRGALRSGNPTAILPFLRTPRPHIFCTDATATMTQGTLAQIESMLCPLLRKAHITPENAIDLLGVRTRLPNFFGLEQNRLDSIGICYMPFAQPSVLRTVFQLPLKLRRNGRLFRQLIRTHAPTLTHHPLVKGGVTYPFGLPVLASHALTRVKKKAGWAWCDTERERFLHKVKPFVLDIAHSEDVRTFAAYDAPRIVQLVTDYYRGEHTRASELDWWLSFEMWRRMLQG